MHAQTCRDIIQYFRFVNWRHRTAAAGNRTRVARIRQAPCQLDHSGVAPTLWNLGVDAAAF